MSDDDARRSAAGGLPADDPAPTETTAASRTPAAAPAAMTGAAPGGSAPVESPARKGSGSFLRELPFLVVVAFGLALLIKTFLVQAFFIPSGSMEQTLAVQDRVLVNKVIYELRDIRRGEIVVFNGEGSFTADPGQIVGAEPDNPVQRVLRAVGGAIGLGAPTEKDFIKRVIGTPGDRVACCTNGRVTVQPPGGQPVELVEPYVYQNASPLPFCAAGSDESACPPGAEGVLVPEGRLFVMGDHRCCSSDSRLHLDDGDNGTVPVDKVIGRAFIVVWPLGHVGLLGVPDTFAREALAHTAVAAPYALGALGALPLAALRRRRRTRAAARSEA